ncbi:MAG: diacylglycerol/lipid kinase family protein, partial [Anaerolineales bacterium]
MEVASGLMGTDVPLAIFPGGTANVMSVELGIPADLAEACALVCGSASAIRTIDVGKVLRVNNPEGGDYFFLTRVGMGLEVQVIEGADRETKDRMGWLAYALSALRALTSPPVAHYRLTLDGWEIESQGVTCVIANSGVITPNSGIAGRTVLSFAPNVNISDGLLDVIVIRATDLGGLLAVAASVVAGTEDAEPLQHWQAREVSANTDPPQNLQCDGELIGQTPITVRVAPQALRVIVPEGSKTVEEQRGG